MRETDLANLFLYGHKSLTVHRHDSASKTPSAKGKQQDIKALKLFYYSYG